MATRGKSAPSVRPAYVVALLACGLAAAAVGLGSSGADAAREKLLRLRAASRARAWSGLDDERRRRELVDLAQELHAGGDQRGVQDVAQVVAAQPAFTTAEKDQVIDLAVSDMWTWNTENPPWKTGLLNQWMDGHGMRGAPQWRTFFDKAPVRLTFQAPPGRYRRLFLEGNWNGEGEISNLDGWRALEMTDAGGGRWASRQSLRLTRLRHAYHAIVRTAPWPDGEALGAAAFLVPGPREVSIARSSAPHARPAVSSSTGTPTLDVAVLGLDGATWYLIEPWARQGYLPNFARLLRGGAVATLISSPDAKGGYPSEPNIYSAMTGKVRLRHGMEKGLGGDNYTTSISRKASPLWKIASDRGLRSAAISMWGTFPPDRLAGKMVTEAFFALKVRAETSSIELSEDPAVTAFADFFGVDADDMRHILFMLDVISKVMATTFPHSLAEQLQAALPRARLEDKGLEAVTRLLDDEVVQVAERLAGGEAFGVFCVYLQGTDVASHIFWNEVQPPDARAPFEPGRGRILKAYQKADDLIGFLLAHSRHLVIFSDHGFGAMPQDVVLRTINVNKVLDRLRRASGLALNPEVEAYQERAGGRRSKGWTVWLGAPARGASVEGLAAYLRGITYVPGGQPVFSRVKVEERGGRVGLRFTVAAMPADAGGMSAGGAPLPLDDFSDVLRLEGTHMGNGIFAAAGPGIRPGRLEEPVHIVDVAPTALYLAGLPQARDMDGELARAAIGDDYFAAHAPQSVSSFGAGGSGWLRLLDAVRLGRGTSYNSHRVR